MKLKSVILSLLFAITTLFFLSATANEACHDEKIYLPSCHIMMTDNGIAVMVNKRMFLTQTICHDANGYYVIGNQLMHAKWPWDPKDRWDCPECDWPCGSEEALKEHLREYHGYP